MRLKIITAVSSERDNTVKQCFCMDIYTCLLKSRSFIFANDEFEMKLGVDSQTSV